MRDWTPLVGYGQGVNVIGPGTVYQILYPIPDFDAGDAEFLIEDEEEQGIFLERIVGEINVATGVDAAVAWQLMPLGVDYEALTVLEPFTTDWDWFSSEWANCKFWDRRHYLASNTVAAASLVDHPYWTQVDCNPRFLLGSKRNLWPVLAMQCLLPATTVTFSHTLRAFWK